MLAALCTERFSEKDGKIKQTDMPCVYPIQLDTEEGAKLDSRNAKIVVCKVAPELMNSMTTEAMLEKALGYPMLINLYAYSDMQQAIGVVSENFDGLQILRDRENAAECIRKAIDAGVDDLVRVGYLQTLASYVADETRGTVFLKRSQTAVGAERRWLYFFEKR